MPTTIEDVRNRLADQPLNSSLGHPPLEKLSLSELVVYCRAVGDRLPHRPLATEYVAPAEVAKLSDADLNWLVHVTMERRLSIIVPNYSQVMQGAWEAALNTLINYGTFTLTMNMEDYGHEPGDIATVTAGDWQKTAHAPRAISEVAALVWLEQQGMIGEPEVAILNANTGGTNEQPTGDQADRDGGG